MHDPAAPATLRRNQPHAEISTTEAAYWREAMHLAIYTIAQYGDALTDLNKAVTAHACADLLREALKLGPQAA